MSSAKAGLSSSSTIALPPYLTTTVRPWNRSSHGSASTSVPALAGGALLADACRPLRRIGRVLGHVRAGHVEYSAFSCT